MAHRARKIRGAIAVVVVWAGAAVTALACSKESPSVTEDAAPPKTCPSGQHVGASGSCVPILAAPPPSGEESAAPSDSASAAASGSAGPGGKCPDPQYADRVATFDWEKEMSVDAASAPKIRAVSGAASETKAVAAEIDLEIRGGCGRIATLLGTKGPFASADAACQAAVDAIRAAKSRLGPGAKTLVDVHQPVCGLALDVVAECTKKCADQGETPGDPACEGGAEIGRCPGTCDGTCELRGASKCDGTCNGRCESGFTGTCTGICKGKCAGKDMKTGGSCTGKCEGTCEGNAKGECKGACDGACTGKNATCAGLCTGKCSAPLAERRCTGWVKAAHVSSACMASCGTRALRKAQCSMPVVAVTVDGAKDASTATQLERAIEAGLPMILKADRQLRGHVDLLQKNQGATTEAMKSLGSSVPPPVSQCLFAFDRAMGEGTSSLAASQRAASSVVTAAQAK